MCCVVLHSTSAARSYDNGPLQSERGNGRHTVVSAHTPAVSLLFLFLHCVVCDHALQLQLLDQLWPHEVALFAGVGVSSALRSVRIRFIEAMSLSMAPGSTPRLAPSVSNEWMERSERGRAAPPAPPTRGQNRTRKKTTKKPLRTEGLVVTTVQEIPAYTHTQTGRRGRAGTLATHARTLHLRPAALTYCTAIEDTTW